MVCHLVLDHLLSLPPSERNRSVHIVSNDTLVESPLVIGHVNSVLSEISVAKNAFSLPVEVAVTKPDVNQTFWVNLIGRGYATPNRSFRWCTDRMKIQPTSDFIRKHVSQTGQVILLLGVRRSESAARSGMVAKYDTGNRLHPHSNLIGCMVFRPIVELDTDDVWEFLSEFDPPWGGSHERLIMLYRDAGGGECPVVTSQDDAPSCGTSSARFGCWTCTVVKKDKSLSGFVESGFEQFTPLLDYRDWLVSIRNDPKRRLARRRNGKFTMGRNGSLVPGPFNLTTRKEMLDRLLELQEKTNMTLISDPEIEHIQTLWVEDVKQSSSQAAKEWMLAKATS